MSSEICLELPKEVRVIGKDFGVISTVIFSMWKSHFCPVYRVRKKKTRKLRKKSRNSL